MPSPFRFHGRRVFLTYPRSSELTRELIGQHLDSLGARAYVVGQERHKDDGIHHHALATWDSAFSSVDARVFDVKGHHPNISGVRSLQRVYAYVTKDDTTPFGSLRVDGNRSIYSDACAATDASEFWRIVRDGDPRQYILNRERLEYYVNCAYGPKRDNRPNGRQFGRVPDDLDAWVFSELMAPQKGI